MATSQRSKTSEFWLFQSEEATFSAELGNVSWFYVENKTIIITLNETR